MAIAKKCDICGKLYEQYNININPNATGSNGFRFVNIDVDKVYQDCVKDCCPECMESIEDHIDKLSIKEEVK